MVHKTPGQIVLLYNIETVTRVRSIHQLSPISPTSTSLFSIQVHHIVARSQPQSKSKFFHCMINHSQTQWIPPHLALGVAPPVFPVCKTPQHAQTPQVCWKFFWLCISTYSQARIIVLLGRPRPPSVCLHRHHFFLDRPLGFIEGRQ
jgi:hypothetical protein